MTAILDSYSVEELEDLIRRATPQQREVIVPAVLPELMAISYERWIKTIFPAYATAPLAPHHHDIWKWVWSITPDEAPETLVGIINRGGAKCRAGTEEVAMADGTRLSLSQVQVGDQILSLDEATKKFVATPITQKWDSGKKRVLKLRTRTGKVATVTPEHRMLTWNGWKEAGELQVGDRLVSPRSLEVDPWALDKSDAEVAFIAYLIAEGSLAGNTRFTNFDQVLVEHFTQCADELGFEVIPERAGSYRLRGVIPYLRSQNLYGHKATEKRLPSWVFGLPPRQKWLFLAVLMDTDGWIAERAAGITLANRALVEDIVYLFLQVGVVTSLIDRPNECAGAWCARIDQESLAACLANMPMRLKKVRLQRVMETARYSLLDTYPFEVLRGLPKGAVTRFKYNGMNLGARYDVTRARLRRLMAFEPHEKWVALESAQVFYDQIELIEDGGEVDTYDIEVAETHNFVGGLLVTHNSTTAEMACVALAARGVRKYVLYVCETQDQADDHVQNVAGMLESKGIALYYPKLGEKMVGKHGNSKGWRRSRIRTASGFTIDALGLDTASRGIKLDEQRPDAMIIDDIDRDTDSPKITRKKIDILTKGIIPAGAENLAVMFIQNLIHAASVAAQLISNKADYLRRRKVVGPIPALINFAYVQNPDGTYSITQGVPTWEGFDKARCEELLNKIGPRAFRTECQHDVNRVEGAFWSREQIDACRVHSHEVPDLVRVVTAIDPSGGDAEHNDEQGIIIVGKGADGNAYVMFDASCKMKPQGWARRAITYHREFDGDKILGEKNYGGQMVESTVTSVDENDRMSMDPDDAPSPIRYKEVNATRGKVWRCEPVAALFGDPDRPEEWKNSKVKFLGAFPELEDELCTWTQDSGWSPNRADAMWTALNELMLSAKSRPKLVCR